MDLNQTPSANRTHIALFGIRNAGKSSIINAITGQNIAIVSDIKGTTTDPVYKSMELLPLGPVTIIDTAGLDDTTTLGNLRIEKSLQILQKTDIAILVIDALKGLTSFDKDILNLITKQQLPYLIVYNKIDLNPNIKQITKNSPHIHFISTKTNEGIYELKNRIATLKKPFEKYILKDIIHFNDTVILIIPVDKSAPKGRLILPQQQVIRELLDIGATIIISQDDNLIDTLNKLNVKPTLIITDSQVFAKINKIVPNDIELTSFSILFSRYKGNLIKQVEAVKILDTITDNDNILIAEGCTHHRQCDDIGTIKLPNWIKKYTNATPKFTFTSGIEFPSDLTKYKLILHCGGCMLNEREMQSRLNTATKQNIPMTNYGTAIAYMNGILQRTLRIFNKKNN